jgi:polyhydroxybutyrate depolymerase
MLIRLILALLLATPALAGDVSKLSFPYRGAERTYYLDVPASAKQDAALVVLLHGSGGNGGFMISRWQDIAAREGIVLLAPDSLHTDQGWDLKDDGPDYIHDLIAAVAAAHPVDRRRIYAFGQSGGAVYSLTLGMLESEYFAAIGFHAGGWRKPAEYKATAYATRKIPIGMWVGDQDEYFPMASLHQTEHVLTQAGFPAELHILDGRRHSYMDVPDDFHDQVWAFFKAHTLDGAPRYADYGAH